MGARSADIVHVDRYPAFSYVTPGEIYLAASASPAKAPFFSGELVNPRRAADLALVVAEVVRSRFFVPPAMRARLMEPSDPVITCSEKMLRIEGFSACCGVYARLDLLGDAFRTERFDAGTTNVDFNPQMRAALAKLDHSRCARLVVSADGVELKSDVASAFERRVALPSRWLKGFVEVQAQQAAMDHRFTVSGATALRFLRSLPRQKTFGTSYVSIAGSMIRLSQTADSGGVEVGGVERLRLLESVAHYADEISLYAGGDGATVWRMNSSDSRLWLALSPSRSRGFSGEGNVLSGLGAAPGAASRVRAALRWQSSIDAAELSRQLDLPEQEIRSALAVLGSSGLVGYDLDSGRYFHRELPFDFSRVTRLHPRLTGARDLLRRGQATIDDTGAWIQGRDGEYRVRQDGAGLRCTCPWFARYSLSRGPCKHIVAVQAMRSQPHD